jgi:hypothetical protein
MRNAGCTKAGGCRVIRHRLFNVATVLSLLLSVATLALWVRSMAHDDQWGTMNDDIDYVNVRGASVLGCSFSLSSSHGTLAFNTETYGDGLKWRECGHMSVAGFSYIHEKNGSIDYHTFGIPHWTVAAMLFVPWGWNRFSRHRRREMTTSCPHCGYNLTANTSGVCPECGTPVESGKDAAA